jgi:hypothetical protein
MEPPQVSSALNEPSPPGTNELSVVVFGSIYASQPAQYHFSRGYHYMEKIQMTWFCLQEFIISGLYLWATRDIIKTQAQPERSTSLTTEGSHKKHVGRVMAQLFIINLVIVVMDIGLLAIEYRGEPCQV